VNEPGLEGSFWPSERQKLLLRTAFAGGEASAEAWRSLRPRLDLDRLELGSFPLLPPVHRQLAALGVEDPYVPRLAGIRRRTWAMNQLELDALTPALRALEEAGAEPVVAGGWELPAHYYGRDFGLRPVDGLEVLVRPGLAAAGAGALAELGFARARGAVARFVAADGRTCTLHERLAREFSVPERGLELEDLWDEMIEISLGETRARALAPSDELVRLCLTGARASVLPNVLWLADALAVLASRAAIDWERLVRHALRLRAMLRLRDALVYLRRELEASIPDEAIRELEAIPPRPRERLAHKKAGRSRWPSTATRFLHVTSDRPLPVALVRLPTFLRDELGLKRRGEVPLEVVRRAATRRRPTVEAK
jgi:hypothetical protein